MKILIAAALASVLAACAQPLQPFSGPDPADSAARVAAVGYRSTTGSYTSQRPVEPAPWREQNERVMPQPKSGQ